MIIASLAFGTCLCSLEVLRKLCVLKLLEISRIFTYASLEERQKGAIQLLSCTCFFILKEIKPLLFSPFFLGSRASPVGLPLCQLSDIRINRNSRSQYNAKILCAIIHRRSDK